MVTLPSLGAWQIAYFEINFEAVKECVYRTISFCLASVDWALFATDFVCIRHKDISLFEFLQQNHDSVILYCLQR